MKTEILFEDGDLLVVRKPAGLATQTAGVGQADVVSELKNYLAASEGRKMPYLGIIHRLDQPVEGLLVFAKNKQTAGALTEQLAGQPQKAGISLHKRYYAVLYGNPSQREGELVDAMYRDASKGRAVIVERNMKSEGEETEQKRRQNGMEDSAADGERGAEARGKMLPKKAVLHYRILQTTRIPSGEEISLADIEIETGRFHQIRAQMAHAGMPLLGDAKYAGEAARACSRRLGIRTVALCAGSLSFVHPMTGENLYFEIRPKSEAFCFFQFQEICK